MKKRSLIAGALFGTLALPVGMFVGLQVSPVLANILLFPILVVSATADTPLGEMSNGLWAAMVVLSVSVWAVVFMALDAAWTWVKRPPAA